MNTEEKRTIEDLMRDLQLATDELECHKNVAWDADSWQYFNLASAHELCKVASLISESANALLEHAKAE